MALPAGTKLGPYEVLSPIGAGGMGEVYRARDERLKRDVAIKVLPATYSQDPDRLRRFEQEAQAAGGLSHPNITAVHDVGSCDGAPYIVTELLEGETLRSRLAAGAIPPRKALEYAIQIARGLAAAHEKGIVHRDLKPENVFLTTDGRVKILDFGLAKLRPEKELVQTEMPTISGTEPGVVLGTMGYMSPEQVRGKPADRRTDIFAFGAILYEMLSGQRAFRGESAADTITAILTKEPPDLSQASRDVPPGLDRIVRHCLEKNPEERFDSARDLAFDLEALSGVAAPPAVAAAAGRSRKTVAVPLILAALVIGGAVGLLAGKRIWFRQPPAFRQLTFRRGQVASARFAPDGRTVLYSAGWEGKPFELFVNRLEALESRPFGLERTELLSISSSGEMAVSLRRHVSGSFMRSGTLARTSVSAGTAPREVLEDVQWADWSPDGKSLAVVRDVAGRNRLEFPIGKVLYETAGWISHPRVSPDGRSVAFVDHSTRGDDGGKVALVGTSGKLSYLAGPFETAQGLAWSANGREVWFTAAPTGSNRSLWAVTTSGQSRLLARGTSPLNIQDVAADGRALIIEDPTRIGMLLRVAGEPQERDVSWLDWSAVSDLSPDGETLLFFESAEGGGPGYSIYLRKTDGSPAVRIGEGSPSTFSPDRAWVASVQHIMASQEMTLLPTGTGEARKLPRDGLSVDRPDWLPDGRHILFTGNEAGRGARVYTQDVAGGHPEAVTPEGFRSFLGTVSPDGKFFVALDPDRKIVLYPLGGGQPKAIPGISGSETPVRWSADGRMLFVYRRGELPAHVDELDVASGRREPWKELMPADPAGIIDIIAIRPTPDGRSYAYSYARVLSNLFLVDGLR